jgi:hypothetical protein
LSSAASRSHGARLAAGYLSDLLFEDYRPSWIADSDRTRSGQVNSRAVAKVVARYVISHPTDVRGEETESKNIRDVIHRALTGQQLSRETLRLVILACGIEERHASALYDLWDGSTPPRALIGSMPPADTRPPVRFVTVQRHEIHTLGESGQPVRHRTVHAIRAVEEGYRVHRYSFDESEVTVERVYGGTPSEPYQLKDNFWAVDITLPRTLAVNEVASMEFITSFHNVEPLEPCFRYAAHQRVTDVMFRVDFHPRRLPKSVHWTEWADYRPPGDVVINSMPVPLDEEFAVSGHLNVMRSAAAGFTWEF